MSKRKFLYLISSLIVLSVYVGYNYMYKSHRDISKEKALFTMNSIELIKEYTANLETATATYLDKTIQLKGVVTEVDEESFTLNEVIVCYTDNITLLNIKNDSSIIVKGRNIGYDELLENIKLDQVTIINN